MSEPIGYMLKHKDGYYAANGKVWKKLAHLKSHVSCFKKSYLNPNEWAVVELVIGKEESMNDVLGDWMLTKALKR